MPIHLALMMPLKSFGTTLEAMWFLHPKDVIALFKEGHEKPFLACAITRIPLLD